MRIKIGKEHYTLAQLARACGGYLVGEDREIGYVCTDSREADENTLFVALRGEHTDGHAYIENVIEGGCRAVLCEKFPSAMAKRACAVVVPDTLRALSDMAFAYLGELNLLRVAVTGSVGKTTTKDFLYAVLRQRFNTYKTEANYNSTIGMPMSVMGIGAPCEAAVLEMGMSARGEIARLSYVAQPDVAVITNVGTSHLEHLQTRENIASAKLEIVTGLKKNGLLVINGDEPLLCRAKSEDFCVRTVSTMGQGDYCVQNVNQSAKGWSTTFDLRLPSGEILKGLRVPTLGAHIVQDAAYAVAVGLEYGISEDDIRRGLLEYRAEGLRLHPVELGGIVVLEDCYNAAPESMIEALHALSVYAQDSGSRAVAVLGDMRELGEDSRRMHEAVGIEAAHLGVGLLMTLGELATSIAEGAMGAGMADACIRMHRRTEDLECAARELYPLLQKGDVVLIKASRAVAAERLLDALGKMMQASAK